MTPTKTPRAGTNTARVLEILSDGKPHSSFELVRRAYNQRHASIARLGSVIHKLKNIYGRSFVAAHSDKNRTKYWYCMVPDTKKETCGKAAIAIMEADDAAQKYD